MNWLLTLSTHPTMVLIFFIIFCAIIGSFLNVIIYRYPIMLEREWENDCLEHLKQPLKTKTDNFNICFPGSHCQACKHAIPFWLNIPIFSYLFLRGKCKFCKTPISFQYFLVEILAPILGTIVILKYGFTSTSMALLFLTFGLLVLSFIDFNHHFLPDAITYILLWCGLMISTDHILISSSQAIFGAISGYLFLWIIAKIYWFTRKKEGMGLGDCKMLAMIGAWVGPLALPNVLLLSTVFALLASIFLLLLKKINHNNPIAFGPYIALGGWCVMLFGDTLTKWLLAWT